MKMMFLNVVKKAVKQKTLVSLCVIAAFAAVPFFLSACSNGSDVPMTVDTLEIAINGFDPVSYFNERRPVRGSEEFEHTWNNAKYHFLSKENLDLFKNNPEMYVPQYNGYCAFAMSRGDYARINPEAYAIVDDKLYLTYDRDIKSAWIRDKENYIAKADRNWQDSEYNNH